jgi:hypothetical protein
MLAFILGHVEIISPGLALIKVRTCNYSLAGEGLMLEFLDLRVSKRVYLRTDQVP